MKGHLILADNKNIKMEKIVALAKRRGFVYPTCEIYGGFANAYSYGPYGVELKNNIKSMWWKIFVTDRDDMVGFDGPILLNPKVWEASGHTIGFNEAQVDCRECKKRYRADHLIEEATGKDLEGKLEEMEKELKDSKIKCPNCGKQNWTKPRFVI
ncbi:glycine--tRNA ligase, partial [Patescibacteria group bacterium]|nr:glycine--tRNA ligase [Patescibacteria group bacterium]